jgi:hypothetical protein
VTNERSYVEFTCNLLLLREWQSNTRYDLSLPTRGNTRLHVDFKSKFLREEKVATEDQV